jgi:hypothetical protein
MTRLELREFEFKQEMLRFCVDRGYSYPPKGMIDDEIRDRFGATIPEICQRLHEHLTGSSEGSAEDVIFDALYLRTVLATWEESIAPQWDAYDAAVKALINAVLAEVKELPELEAA